MVGRTAVNIPGTQYQSYVFNGTKFVQYSWNAGSTDGKILLGPSEVDDEWVPLKKLGFRQIDAILPIESGGFFVFSGEQYARISYSPGDKAEPTVLPITNWQSLNNAGFKHVDAAYNVPGHPGQVYFVCGYEYCRAEYTEKPFSDKLLDLPKLITDGWSAITFPTVDMFIPVPGSTNEAYAFWFGGGKYSTVNLTPNNTNIVLDGPKDIGSDFPELNKNDML